MICDDCGKKPATMHLTRIINGKVTESHLCEECAKTHKELDSSFSIHNFLTGLLDTSQDGPLKIDYIKGTKCDKCGMTYGQFKQTGKFGCSTCYKSFKEKLGPVFKSIHGHDRHIGKVPRKAGGVIMLRKEVERLKAKLEGAVKSEEFEKAAKLRDEIKEIQKQIDE